VFNEGRRRIDVNATVIIPGFAPKINFALTMPTTE
jgi:hypothetical protein